MHQGDFVEVFVDCDLAVCEQRDPKGLYAKARVGEIPNFTVISAPYEPPVSPELIVRTADHSVEQCARQIVSFLKERGYATDPDEPRSPTRQLIKS